jgi:ribonuclease P protein component
MTKIKKYFSFSKKEIDETFKSAKPLYKENGLKILQTPTTKEFGKLLIITPKKSGKAFQRNLIKRRLKAIFYEEKLFEKPFVNIIFVYKTAMDLKFQDLKDILIKNLQHD